MPLPAKNGTKNPRYLILHDSYLLKDEILHCKYNILDGCWTAVPSNKSCINVWVFISPLLLSGAFPNSCIQPTRRQHDLLNKTLRWLCRPVTDADAIWSQMQMQSGHIYKCNLFAYTNAIWSQMQMQSGHIYKCNLVTNANQSGHKCKCNTVTNANASHKPPNVLKMYQCTLCAQECEETPLTSVHTMSSFESSTITANTWKKKQV